MKAPEYYLDEAIKLIRLKGIDEPMEVTVYHGFRSKKSLDQIRKDGNTYPYNTPMKLKTDVSEVLRNFNCNLDNPLASWEYSDKKRWCIWATLHEKGACNWAIRSPEIIWVTLDDAVWREDKKLDHTKVVAYREERYGFPINAKISMRLPAGVIFGSPLNINTGRKKISPNEILDLRVCTLEDYT